MPHRCRNLSGSLTKGVLSSLRDCCSKQFNLIITCWLSKTWCVSYKMVLPLCFSSLFRGRCRCRITIWHGSWFAYGGRSTGWRWSRCVTVTKRCWMMPRMSWRSVRRTRTCCVTSPWKPPSLCPPLSNILVSPRWTSTPDDSPSVEKPGKERSPSRKLNTQLLLTLETKDLFHFSVKIGLLQKKKNLSFLQITKPYCTLFDLTTGGHIWKCSNQQYRYNY